MAQRHAVDSNALVRHIWAVDYDAYSFAAHPSPNLIILFQFKLNLNFQRTTKCHQPVHLNHSAS